MSFLIDKSTSKKGASVLKEFASLNLTFVAFHMKLMNFGKACILNDQLYEIFSYYDFKHLVIICRQNDHFNYSCPAKPRFI